MELVTTPSVAERIALTLGGLGRAVAARIAGGAMQAVMILLVWRRIRRVEGQILGLLARFREGRLRAAPVVSPGGLRGGRAGPRAGQLPRGFGWLLPLVPSEAACYAGQLRASLAEPEMVALLVATPRAKRVLAPLCRMLGIEASLLAPGDLAGGAAEVAPEAEVAAELERLAGYAGPGFAAAPWRRSPGWVGDWDAVPDG